jgi:peptidoglycan/LPS O-acetylase OafA/YrhL
MVWLERASLGLGAAALGLKYWFVHVDHVSIFSIGAGLHQLSLTAVFLLCISFAMFSDRSRFTGVLCTAPLRYLGNMSFSYYLTHSLAIKFLTLFPTAVVLAVHSAVGFWLMVPATFAISLIPAVVLFLAVEQRFSNRMRIIPVEVVPTPMSAAA